MPADSYFAHGAIRFTIAGMKNYYLLLLLLCSMGQARADWTVLLPEDYRTEVAIQIAVKDLATEGLAHGIVIRTGTQSSSLQTHRIVVGSAGRNPTAANLQREGTFLPQGVKKPEGFEIFTVTEEGAKTVWVSGGSVAGDVYGLYWVWDRIRAFGHIPDINVKREPVLDHRYTRIPVRSKADIERALRYGLNLVFGENPLRLVPWNTEPERTENGAYRETTRELAEYAHRLGLKFMTFGTDFTYHPSLLEEFGATLDPEDPRFWEAVQAKYRRLLKAMPELDGVGTFIADEQRYWGEYRTFDVVHGGGEGDWSPAKRHRTFVTKVWEVVVGEFDKLLLHRTWAPNAFEQQAQPAVYESIFTDEVPSKNLYLIPSFTQNDRWFFQSYNPTINRTPHRTMVVCENLDYHAGGNLFPTYPGPYFQAGLQTMLDTSSSNLVGVSLDLPGHEDWRTRSLTAYTVARLSWNHHEDVETIARDFCAIHFGPEAATGMAEILLMSPVAYKYGLYIEPAAYGQFNSLPHIRVGQFVARGYPSIDGGKEHIEFLRNLYLRCKPWIPETLAYLDHGQATVERMLEQLQRTRDKIAKEEVAEDIVEALETTQILIRTNNRYVKTFFAYFQYREDPSDENRLALKNLDADLRATRDQFVKSPGYGYQMFGVDQLLINVREALEDLSQAETNLVEAPSSDEIERFVEEEQKRYVEVLKEHVDETVHLLTWRGKIDGRDLLRIRGSEVEVEHLRWDGPSVEKSEVHAPLPRKGGTVLPKRIGTRDAHPFVLEQPSEENLYTAEIYLYDIPSGGDWWEFELYFIPRDPSELGLRQTLKRR